MEQNVAEGDRAVDRARVEVGRGVVDRDAVAWGAPLLGVLSAPAYARNAGTVNRMSVECPVCRSSVPSAVLR